MRGRVLCLAFLFWSAHVSGGIGIPPQEKEAEPPVTAPPSALRAHPFYKKYVSAEGLPILSSEKVSDLALRRARFLVLQLLAHRPDIRRVLMENDVRVVVMHVTEMTTDVPEHSHLRPKEYWDRRARGLGGRITSCGEENLLHWPEDRYFNENILIHEFAHCIHTQGMRRLDPTFDERLRTIYEKAMSRGLWKDTYAASNPSEYWAEGVQSYFDTNRQFWVDTSGRAHHRDHNHVNTREELFAYDPDLANLIAEVFGRVSWRYRPPVVPPPPALEADPFYQKYTSTRGLVILGSGKVSDEALLEVNDMIERLLSERWDLLGALVEEGVRIVVLHPSEKITDIPEWRHRESREVWDPQGRAAAGHLTVVAEENLLSLSGDSHAGESLFLHVFAHTLQEFALRRSDREFDRRLARLYRQAMDKGLWEGTHAARNPAEYWAEGVQSYFDANRESGPGHNGVNTREELERYDPDLARLVAEVFKRPAWRYRFPGNREKS